MRVVADTNVAVSGLLWHGPPNQLLRWCRDGYLQILACEKTTTGISNKNKIFEIFIKIPPFSLLKYYIVLLFKKLIEKIKNNKINYLFCERTIKVVPHFDRLIIFILSSFAI